MRNQALGLNNILPPAEYLTRADGVRIAFRYVKGAGNKKSLPTLVFLPGYMSDMQGSKALALEDWAIKNGRGVLRLDYSGCGESGGDFADGTLSSWRDDVVLAVELILRGGPVILIGSSMGGWVMLMAARALGDTVKGLVGIAVAPDFTQWGFTEEEKAVIRRDGVLLSENPYGPEATPTYCKLFEDGDRNLQLVQDIPVTCPVRLLHGQCDNDVPWDISIQLAAKLRSSDVQVILVKDGDHRLSRDTDIALLLDTVSRMPIV
jgi:pimeloyl-ACP methyl ester carboxylesterase